MPGLGGVFVWSGRSAPRWGGRGWCVWSGGSALGGVAWSGPGGVWSGGGCLVWGGIPACTEADTPPVDRHTLVKTLPWPNFVAAGN